MIALDASALLAFLFREQGAEQVAAHLSESCLSAVNLAEVIGRFSATGLVLRSRCHGAFQRSPRIATGRSSGSVSR